MKTCSFLIISPEAWSQHFVSKHHYAMILAELGHNVYFLDPPIDSLTDWEVEATSENPRVITVRGPRVALGLRFMPQMVRRAIERRWLERLEAKIGHAIDVVWLFENSRFYDMSFAGSRLKLYFRADLFQNYHPEEAASSCDIMFTIADGMRRHGESCGARAYTLQHGYKPQATVRLLSAEQQARFVSGRPNLALVGNLEIFELNVPLIQRCAEEFPDAVFHLVGGYKPDGQVYPKLSHLNNIVWWGKVPHDSVFPILQRADVLMVCYRSHEYEEQVANSHKVMEYMASGKMIVATHVDEYRNHTHLLQMTKSYDEYVEMMRRVLGDLAFFNSSDKVAMRQAFAEQHTYDKQIEKIFSIIEKEGFGHYLM